MLSYKRSLHHFFQNSESQLKLGKAAEQWTMEREDLTDAGEQYQSLSQSSLIEPFGLFSLIIVSVPFVFCYIF